MYLLMALLVLAVFRIEASTSKDIKLKVLHLTFHKGCEKEVKGLAVDLGLDLTTWFIPDLPPKFFDGETSGNCLYNIGHKRAERIWNLHRHFFEQFDVILTSDTAPLSRIFLQNSSTKPLIIWICNRFDYSDQASLDCEFPDTEYYQLFSQAKNQPNVTIVAYTPFEHHYAKSKGIDTGEMVITPCSSNLSAQNTSHFTSSIPTHIDKANTFFLPPYHNEKHFIDLNQHCTELGIPTYCGHYNGPLDLKDFKGIIHLPYAWSNLAFFENIALGIPYFIPSKEFLTTLALMPNYFHQDLHFLLQEDLFHLSEWYCPEHAQVFTFFDSWEDLAQKASTMDDSMLRQKTLNFSQQHRLMMLSKWESVFNSLMNQEIEYNHKI